MSSSRLQYADMMMIMMMHFSISTYNLSLKGEIKIESSNEKFVIFEADYI